MNTDRPRFSIVMPTRNRAHLLRHALDSARAQTFDDFEIVVSNNNSTDETATVAQSTGDPRVRYVQTEHTLPMPMHWEFALGHARGESVTYLCDDDAIVPTLLERIVAHQDESPAEVIYWDSATYYHRSWFERRKRNLLTVGPSETTPQQQSGESLLDDLFDLRQFERNFPKMLNSCCSRALIERIQQRCGRIFIESCPDYSSAALVAAMADRCIYLPLPLMLTGAASESIGASTRRRMSSDATDEFWGEYTDGYEINWHAPLRQGSVCNAIADTLLRTRDVLKEHRPCPELSWGRYFMQCREEIATEGRFGGDTIELLAQFDEALADEPNEVRQAVATTRRDNHARRWRHWPSRIKQSLLPVLPARWYSALSSWEIIPGRSAGFDDIAGAAAHVEQYLPPVTQRANSESSAESAGQPGGMATA